MNTYTVEINLLVKVDAFSKEDAFEAVEDVFGPGEVCGLDVEEFEVVESVEQSR